jgi:hypothetical protein
MEQLLNIPYNNTTTLNQLLNNCDKKLFTTITNIFKSNGLEQLDSIKSNLEQKLPTNTNDQHNNAEHSTPHTLCNKMINRIEPIFWSKQPKLLDYCCGKGNIVFNLFYNYYLNTIEKYNNPFECCKDILENFLYLGDINPNNIFITISILHNLAFLLTKTNYYYSYNIYIGDSFVLDINNHWGIHKFDGIMVNPPFQDSEKRNKTPHKLWIDFTKKTFKDWLKDDGLLLQISPCSFSSPSSKILELFKQKTVKHLFLNEEHYFPNINSSISWYIVQNSISQTNLTNINDTHSIQINSELLYLPNPLTIQSLTIHKKIMFDTILKQKVERDYVTAHNILIKKPNPTLSKIKTPTHIYPLLHTNKQIWYSSIKQSFLDKKKIMWSRSGYTKPIYDNGTLGITDLSYYILVSNDEEGSNLLNNLNTKVFKYILKTAKWSGFGNDKVFYNLPKLPNQKLTDDEMFNLFSISPSEQLYIENILG